MSTQALTFITCGSVDDGKSTLIGRLLLDSQAVMRDQLEAVSRTGAADLALLTDGLSAEREQGITIDVAWRYFSTPARKFIIGDCPGHEQYTRNMVTAASNADCAVLLVDATKLAWQTAPVQLLAQTRRHALLCRLLGVPHIVFAINKLDAVADAETAFNHLSQALGKLAQEAGITPAAVVPISGLSGAHVLVKNPAWSWHSGDSLLSILERLPARSQLPAASGGQAAMAVQWVEKTASASATTAHGRRIAWGRVGQGVLSVGDTLVLQQAGGAQRSVQVAKLLSTVRESVQQVATGASAGVVFSAEIDVSRGDWLLSTAPASDVSEDDFDTPAAKAAQATARQLKATVSWLDDEPLVTGRVYWALHGHRWVKAKVSRIIERLDVQTFERSPAASLAANDIAEVELSLAGDLPHAAYANNQALGSLILVDAASHKTAAAVLLS